MTRRDDQNVNIAGHDGPGFQSLDELRTFIRIACEWDASLGIPLPKRPRREKAADDRGSEL